MEVAEEESTPHKEVQKIERLTRSLTERSSSCHVRLSSSLQNTIGKWASQLRRSCWVQHHTLSSFSMITEGIHEYQDQMLP